MKSNVLGLKATLVVHYVPLLVHRSQGYKMQLHFQCPTSGASFTEHQLRASHVFQSTETPKVSTLIETFQPLFSDLFILIQYETCMHTANLRQVYSHCCSVNLDQKFVSHHIWPLLYLCSQRAIGKEAQFHLSTEVRRILAFISVVESVFRYTAMNFPCFGIEICDVHYCGCFFGHTQ